MACTCSSLKPNNHACMHAATACIGGSGGHGRGGRRSRWTQLGSGCVVRSTARRCRRFQRWDSVQEEAADVDSSRWAVWRMAWGHWCACIHAHSCTCKHRSCRGTVPSRSPERAHACMHLAAPGAWPWSPPVVQPGLQGRGLEPEPQQQRATSRAKKVCGVVRRMEKGVHADDAQSYSMHALNACACTSARGQSKASLMQSH